jgi:hypothetical protein
MHRGQTRGRKSSSGGLGPLAIEEPDWNVLAPSDALARSRRNLTEPADVDAPPLACFPLHSPLLSKIHTSSPLSNQRSKRIGAACVHPLETNPNRECQTTPSSPTVAVLVSASAVSPFLPHISLSLSPLSVAFAYRCFLLTSTSLRKPFTCPF